MGKKGKRSKRQQAKNKKAETNEIIIDNILNRLNEYDKRAKKSSEKYLNSDAVSSIKKAIQLVEAKEAIIVKAKTGIDLYYEYLIMLAYSKLIVAEYTNRCNYEEVIQIYNCLTLKYNSATALIKMFTSDNHLETLMILIMMYQDLALIRVGEDIAADSFLFEHVTNCMKNAGRDLATICNLRIVSCLRATKNFGAAIHMDKKFASIRNLDEQEQIGSAASLAITYIERYRVEFHKHTKKENKQIFDQLSKLIVETVPQQNHEWHSIRYDDELHLSHAVALVQWYYLLSKGRERGDKEWTEFRRQAIFFTRKFIAKKWQMKDNCFYCHQAPTEHEVKLACGDCRVACYCSIDHQRASWKKSAVHDMCFGHEAICPAMKAYRKWQEAIDSSDIEKEEKMERRFGRECLGFLAYGLGLEDKCYDSEEVESG